MERKEYEAQRLCHKRGRKSDKILLSVIALLLVLIVGTGATLAYLFTQTDGITNTFTPSSIKVDINEEFDGTVKKNVNVKNIGNTDAYVRIKLVTYRVNDKSDHIGGEATIPTFEKGENWVEYEGYYYYTLPVKPNETPCTNLVDQITLKQYNDADGGKQVIEVMAEGIQSEPAEAVGEAWGVSILEGSVTPYVQGGAR